MIRASRWIAWTSTVLSLLLALLIAEARLTAAEPSTTEKPVGPAVSPAASAPAENGQGQPPSVSPAAKEDTQRGEGGFWRIQLDMDVPSLLPQAVQYAIFDKDPVADFTAQVKRTQAFSRPRLEKADDDAKRELLRDISMSVSWDFVFREIRGDEVHLLTRHPDVPVATTTASSNAPAGKRWVATKIVKIKGRPVCWCIPAEVKAGQRVKVTFSEKNMFDLRGAYRKARYDALTDGGKEQEEQASEGRPSVLATPPNAPEHPAADKVPKPTEGDAQGYELYRQMIAAMRRATSLSYVSRYHVQGKGDFALDCTYRVWLKKPNYFRVETESPAQGKGGILIGDGERLWIYWPQGRPFGDDDSEADKKARATSYMTKPARVGGHSIGHETGYLGAGMDMPIIDPSTFHGYTDSLQPYLDGVTSLAAEKVGEEDCDHILVSIMKHQRTWELWLSKVDHLPRKLRQVVHVSYDIIITEEWSAVTVNAEIPDAMFAWKPPEGWTEWRRPPIEAGLLKPGSDAPDFELDSADGTRIKLSDFHGKIVWFYVWRAG